MASRKVTEQLQEVSSHHCPTCFGTLKRVAKAVWCESCGFEGLEVEEAETVTIPREVALESLEALRALRRRERIRSITSPATKYIDEAIGVLRSAVSDPTVH